MNLLLQKFKFLLPSQTSNGKAKMILKAKCRYTGVNNGEYPGLPRLPANWCLLLVGSRLRTWYPTFYLENASYLLHNTNTIMSLLLTICIICALAFLIFNSIVYPKLVSPLSKIPNAHFTARFSSFWIKFQRRGGRTGIKPIFEAHRRNGPVIRVGPNEVSVASLDGLRQVYTGAFEKTGFYLEFMNFKIPNLVSMMGNQPHSIQKRMISNVYSKSFIQSSPDLETLSKVLL